MEYRFRYETPLVDDENSDNSKTSKDEKISGSLDTFYLKNKVLFAYIDKINNYLNKFNLKLSINYNKLENNNSRYLVIESNSEVSIAGGVNSLAISLTDMNKLLLITFEPMKIIYNSYIKELGQELVGTVTGDGVYVYIILLNQLEKITDKKLLNDIRTVDAEADHLSQMFKDPQDAITTLIKIVKVHKDIENKDLLINGLKTCLVVYRKMIKDYPILDSLRFRLDLHTGNWKYCTTSKGKILIPIDPFVIFYAKFKHTTSIFIALYKNIIKNSRK